MSDKIVETSSPDGDLTGSEPTQESHEGSTEPQETKETPEKETNWQAALQKAREREKEKESELKKAQEALRKYENEEKKKKMADMTEADRYKSIATEEAEKRARLQLKLTINDAVKGLNIPSSLLDALHRIPWEIIPEVQQELASIEGEPSWDEVIASVESHLPEYLESFKVGTVTESKEEPSGKVDSERSLGDETVIRGHVYTREEIARLQQDPKEYEKHRPAILAQLQKQGGTML